VTLSCRDRRGVSDGISSVLTSVSSCEDGCSSQRLHMQTNIRCCDTARGLRRRIANVMRHSVFGKLDGGLAVIQGVGTFVLAEIRVSAALLRGARCEAARYSRVCITRCPSSVDCARIWAFSEELFSWFATLLGAAAPRNVRQVAYPPLVWAC